MKYSNLILLACTALTAACSDGTGPNADVTRYHLVDLQGRTPPIETTTTGLDGNGNVIETCAETLHSQYLELSKPDRAAMVTDRTRSCNGAPALRQTATQAGSFTEAGDTVHITLAYGGLIGNVTNRYIRLGDRLILRAVVYTEADPDGTSGQTYDVATYQTR